MSEKQFNVDEILKKIFEGETLTDLYDERVKELGIAPTNSLEIMDIEYRPLQNILKGASTRVDAKNFIKISKFLNIPLERVIKLFYKALENNFPELQEYPKEKQDFINKNFDLASLKRMGFLKDITNYRHIEESILHYFGFKSIFEFRLPDQDIAFSSGARLPKSILSKSFWLKSAINTFEALSNPNTYDRKALMDYIPEIRWQSTNVLEGLKNVINDLYSLGVSVLYQQSFSSLHLKGATLIVNEKPCIVITNYSGFYTTLWHTLCHEISHVLFDLDDIRKSKYHISENDVNELPIQEKEDAADYFAREYLFSKEKLELAKPHINNKKFIENFASRNQVHPSFIYTYYAFEYDNEDQRSWSRAKIKDPFYSDSLNLESLKEIENDWKDIEPIEKHIANLREKGMYN